MALLRPGVGNPTIVSAPPPSGDTTGAVDTAVIQGLMDTLAGFGGGTVRLPYAPQTAPYLITTVSLRTNVELVGVSMQGTVVKAISGHSTTSMVMLLTGGEYGWAIRNVTLDGGNGSTRKATANLQANQFSVIEINGAANTGQMFGFYDTDMNGHIEDVTIANSARHSFYCYGRVSEMRLRNVYSIGPRERGFYIANQDVWLDSCTSGQAGQEGFVLNAKSIQASNCKAWYSGRNNSSLGDGFRITTAASGVLLDGCFAQDNASAGFADEGSANRITGVAGGNTAAHLALRGCTDGHHEITLNDSANLTAAATVSLAVTGAPLRNYVRMDGKITSTALVTSGADLGGNTVTFGLLNNDSGLGGSTLSSGQESVHRLLASSTYTPTSGTLALTMFTARKTEAVTKIAAVVRGTAAGTTTFARMGLYTVDVNGNITLVASCAADSTLFNTTFNSHQRNLTSSYTVTAGQRYALGILVAATTMPAFYACASPADIALLPMLTGAVAGQADLPASVAVGSISTGGNPIYGKIAP